MPSCDDDRPLYIIWLATPDIKHYGDFRLQEVKSLFNLFDIDTVQLPDQLDQDCPYLVVSLPDDGVCQSICARAVLIENISRLWASSTISYRHLLDEAVAFLARTPSSSPAPNQSLCIRFKTFGKKLPESESRLIVGDFMKSLNFPNPIRLRDPDIQFTIYCDYGFDDGDRERGLRRCFFARLLSIRPHSLEYSLKTRVYIGPTSTDAQLAQLMANQVQATAASLIMDPFAGTGSLLIACAAFGAVVFGNDIDWNVVHGKGGVNYRSNFSQYHLPRGDIVRADISIPVWRGSMQLDGIVTDPPYGIRAGARRSGSDRERVSGKTVDAQFWNSHHPPTRAYPVDDVMTDLLAFSARHLRIGARLVYLLPAGADFHESNLPAHPDLRPIAMSQQVCAAGLHRYLITMIRIPSSSSP